MRFIPRKYQSKDNEFSAFNLKAGSDLRYFPGCVHLARQLVGVQRVEPGYVQVTCEHITYSNSVCMCSLHHH